MEFILGAIGALGVFLIIIGALGINERREMNARIASRLPVPTPR